MKKSLIAVIILVVALVAFGCSKEHVHELTKVEGIAATCTATGVADYWTCSGCGMLFADENGATEIVKDNTLPAQLITAIIPHDYVDHDKDCTTAKQCKGCALVEDVEPNKEHTAKADDGDCTTAVTCEHCSVVLVEKKTHTGGTATCTAKANCANCGKAYGATDPNNHDYTAALVLWSEDYNSCTIAGACARCNKAVYETVNTTYANGKAIAAFSVGTRAYALNSYAGKCAEEMDAAITYMLANGETDIEVIFPALEGNSGATYEAFYKVVTWALTGFETPNEITAAWNAYLWIQGQIPGAVETAKITALDRYNWAKNTFLNIKDGVVDYIESVNP